MLIVLRLLHVPLLPALYIAPIPALPSRLPQCRENYRAYHPQSDNCHYPHERISKTFAQHAHSRFRSRLYTPRRDCPTLNSMLASRTCTRTGEHEIAWADRIGLNASNAVTAPRSPVAPTAVVMSSSRPSCATIAVNFTTPLFGSAFPPAQALNVRLQALSRTGPGRRNPRFAFHPPSRRLSADCLTAASGDSPGSISNRNALFPLLIG